MEKLDIDSLKETYRRDGYVVLRGFLNGSEVADINQALQRVIENRMHAMPGNHVVYEDKNDRNTLKLLQDLHQYDPFFSSLLFESKFKEIAETLLADDAIGKTVEYFNKPPGLERPLPYIRMHTTSCCNHQRQLPCGLLSKMWTKKTAAYDM